MTRQTKTIEEITCDICDKVTPENYGLVNFKARTPIDRAEGTKCDTFSIGISGVLAYGSRPIEDLCRDCAKHVLELSLKTFEPIPEKLK